MLSHGFSQPNGSKLNDVETSINVLNQAVQYLKEHDYAAAQMMIAVARQMLEDLQIEFEHHLQVEATLKKLLNPPSQ